MQKTYDFYKETSTAFTDVVKSLIGNRLITQDDIEDVRYSIFSLTSPQDNEGVPVEGFDDVPLDKATVMWNTLQETEVTDKYGTKPMSYNFCFIVAPEETIVGGESAKVFPFPVIGGCYRVVVIFKINKTLNPGFPDFATTYTGYAV